MTSRGDARSTRRSSLWRSPGLNLVGRFAALATVFAFFALMVDDGKFYSLRNLENILRQSCVYATAALGMTLVIVSAGIDLSVGSLIALTVVVTASTLSMGYETVDAAGVPSQTYYVTAWPVLWPLLAAAAGTLAASLAGMCNGLLIVRLRLAPFIVTLGAMGIVRGIAKGIAGEKDIYPPVDTWIASLMDPTITSADRQWKLLPTGVWILIVAAVCASILMRYTRFGRHVFAIGSNQDTARLCGVPVERTKTLVYLLSGFFAALAGLMQFSFVGGIGQPTTGVAYELYVIAAVVIGGGSLLGGEGSVLSSLLGALIITILNMGGQQMEWPKWVQELAIGAIIIGAVALDQWRHRRLVS